MPSNNTTCDQPMPDETKTAVGPSAPPMIPMEAALLLQPLKQNTDATDKSNNVTIAI